jgi:hypothetical protein
MKNVLVLMYRDSLGMFNINSRCTSTYMNADNFPELFKVPGLSIFDKACFYWQKMQHMNRNSFLNKY